MTKKPLIFGSFEVVSVPSLGVHDAVAKVDTGAYSGALHCSSIRETKNQKGKKVLQFTPSNNYGHVFEIGKYITTNVRSSTGHYVKRYLFDTKIDINGIEYPTRIGLSDRSDMNYEVLIGRRFLRENNILVDARINQEYDIDKAKKDKL